MAEHVHIYIYITLIIASDIQPHNSPRIGRLHSPECQTTSWSQAECNLFFSALLRHYLSILSLLFSPAVFDFNRFGHVRRRSREMQTMSCHCKRILILLYEPELVLKCFTLPVTTNYHIKPMPTFIVSRPQLCVFNMIRAATNNYSHNKSFRV